MLNKTLKILLLFFLIFTGLYFSKPFLFPLTLAAIVAMLLLPLSKRIEGKGCSRPVSAIFCLLILVAILVGIVSLLVWQMSDIAKDFSEMQGKVLEIFHQIQRFVHFKLGISEQEQKKLLQSSRSAQGGMGKILSNTLGAVVDLILGLVYIFIFLIFRDHLKKFVLKLVPPQKKEMTEKIVHDTALVSYKYLSGLAMMIVMLWVLYGIGFSIIGIKNAIFFAVLCGILEIVPFIGNLTGTSVTILMAVTQGGGVDLVLGVIITYFFVQFIQSYIIEPLVVGAEVNINPLFTIISLVVGELVWGIAGLVVAIPLVGMLKIVCDNIEPLKPYGYLIGEEKRTSTKRQWVEKLKKIFSKNTVSEE